MVRWQYFRPSKLGRRLRMSAKVINLDEHRPHMTGRARCIGCKHEWVSVGPVGVTTFECPNCSAMKGIYVNLCYPSDDSKVLIFVCECGNDLFICRGDGYKQCVNCGLAHLD